MSALLKPNYKNGSIVNLVASIQKTLGGDATYNELKSLPAKKLKKYDNIILLVADGMGYEFLKKQKDNVFSKHLKGKITSVFLPSTASAITSFLTGVAPQQHAITGWFVHLKELGGVAAPLRFRPRGSDTDYTKRGVSIDSVFELDSIFSKLKASSYFIQLKKLSNTPYTKLFSKGAKKKRYRTLRGALWHTKRAIKNRRKKTFTYLYWPDIDTKSHHHGTKSKQAKAAFDELDKKFGKFLKRIKGTNTCVIVTADHGLIDTTKERTVNVSKDPVFNECLTLPLAGDMRTAYCYVRPSKAKKFEKYNKEKLSKLWDIYKSEELIKKGFFGLGKPNKKLFDRTGDYILVAKENYVIKDQIVGEKFEFLKGNHGGLSPEELYVPLIVVDCN